MRRLAQLTVTFAILLSVQPLHAASADGSCKKPPHLVSDPGSSKEYRKKARDLRAQGAVGIVINEQGDVVEAKLLRASSKEAGELLLERASGMKFSARAGCGSFKTAVNFTLSD